MLLDGHLGGFPEERAETFEKLTQPRLVWLMQRERYECGNRASWNGWDSRDAFKKNVTRDSIVMRMLKATT